MRDETRWSRRRFLTALGAAAGGGLAGCVLPGLHGRRAPTAEERRLLAGADGGDVVRTLRNAIEQDRLAHAYIFSGLRGTGKTSAARILATCLNCEQGPTPTPCNDCSNVRWSRSHPWRSCAAAP